MALKRAVWWGVPGYLLAAAAYQLALMVDRQTEGSGWASFVALPAMLLGAGLAFVSAASDRPPWNVALLAPSAAAFMVTRFYSYDSYYDPALRRYSDGGVVAPVWIFVLVGADAAVAAAYPFDPKVAAILTAGALLVTAFTTLIMGTGH